MWWVSRVFVIVTFFFSTITKYLDFLKDYIFEYTTLDWVSHFRFILFQFYFIAHAIMAFLAFMGVFPFVNKIIEKIKLSEKEKEALEKKKLKKSKFRISFFDLFRLATYGWYLILPGLFFAFIQFDNILFFDYFFF